jgi:expansin (peptidoglycan-binding protein)
LLVFTEHADVITESNRTGLLNAGVPACLTGEALVVQVPKGTSDEGIPNRLARRCIPGDGQDHSSDAHTNADG